METQNNQGGDITPAPGKFAIFGHPLHPTLIPFPVAFLTGVLVTDLTYWVTQDPFWSRASLWLVGAGAVMGILAALGGLVEFLTIERARAHVAGWIHFLGNSTALVLALINLLFRLGDEEAAILPWGILLSGVTLGLISLTSWFGGELVFKYLVGVHGPGGDSSK